MKTNDAPSAVIDPPAVLTTSEVSWRFRPPTIVDWR
jgi:hypothetical protein